VGDFQPTSVGAAGRTRGYCVKLLAALIFAAAAWGQGITPPQLRITPPVPASSTAARLIALVAGRFQSVEIGTGVSLTATTGGFKLESTLPPASVLQLKRIKLTQAADGSYPGHVAGSAVYRNGILQSDDDYTVESQSIKPKEKWGTDDTILMLQVVTCPPVENCAVVTLSRMPPAL